MRLTPDLRRPDVLRDLADVTRLHNRVMSLFPDGLGDTPRRETGALFRVEAVNDAVRVLIQSALQPEPARLPDGFGDFAVLKLKDFLASLHDGLEVRYRITANPSKQLPRGHTGPGRPGQRIALRGPEAEAWWHRRAQAAGLDLRSVVMHPRRDLGANRPDRKAMRLAAAQFEGTAVIADAGAVERAIRQGIGHGKSYGCGLLSVMPVRRREG
jgi:CRISPR system Cascade subunit CasE